MNDGPEHHEVVIVGAGASGIGAAIRLAKAGVEDIVVLEKGDDVGGTWRDNTYPGCACDVPSALYSYSFAPNPEWTRAFAQQPEIRAYLRATAERFGVTERIRLGVQVRHTQWDDDAQQWRIETSAGAYTARFVVAGAGPWHEPQIPNLPGLDTFGGESFHSARWNHDYDLTGKRVAVIGTGASAVQFVPEIAKSVAELHLFQRTAQWVLPKPDHYVPRAERWVMRNVPGAQRALRTAEYLGMETLGIGFRHPAMLRVIQRAGTANLRRSIGDPQLRAKLTPDYTLGCKRLLMSNSYYPALARPNVSVHATAVDRVEGNRVIGADGSEASNVEVDVIIFGTGFHILDMPVADHVADADGRTLAEHWQGSPEAYLGTSVAGFPNFFLVLGPALGTGHSSAFSILEAQLEHIAKAITAARAKSGTSIEVRREVQDAFIADVQEALPGTVYNNGGCSSYYMDANGRNSFNWPWSTNRLRSQVGRFNADDYVVVERGRTTTRIRVTAAE